MWLDDRGWWLIVVEFQASSWSKGTYLNVGAMWLWQRTGDISFDFGHRVEGHREFRDEASFVADAAELAQSAASEVLRYRAMFPGIAAVADVLQRRATGSEWDRYHAAIAAALASRARRADTDLAALTKGRGDAPWQQELRTLAQELRTTLTQPDIFRARVTTVVRETRAALKLPAWDGQLPTVGDPPTAT